MWLWTLPHKNTGFCRWNKRYFLYLLQNSKLKYQSEKRLLWPLYSHLCYHKIILILFLNFIFVSISIWISLICVLLACFSGLQTLLTNLKHNLCFLAVLLVRKENTYLIYIGFLHHHFLHNYNTIWLYYLHYRLEFQMDLICVVFRCVF